LKITGIEVIPVNPPINAPLSISYTTFRTFNFVVLKAHTDEGYVGLGECPPLPPLSRESQNTILSVLEAHLAPAVIGENPFCTERIWEKMDSAMPGYPLPKAALDMALYDLMGKKLGVSVYDLLGGLTSREFPLVGLIGLMPLKETVDSVKRYLESGYTGLRLKIGRGLRSDEQSLREVRRVAGDDTSIRLDANQAYLPDKAISVIKALERYDIELVEQPTPWWDYKGLGKVARAVDTPIMPHESLYLLSDVKTLIEYEALDVLGLKVYRPGGGLTNAKKLISMAELMDIPCLVHDDVELGISLAAASHLIASNSRNIRYKCELSGYPEWIADDIVKQPMEFRNGRVKVPEGPGLGVEIDDDKLKKYSSPDVRYIGQSQAAT
jgi:L-alanine-DL-glutamate epimerase-like enolase superfamily enzyme